MSQPEAAVAIVRAAVPHESILLIRRTERADDPWSGHWSFPGGRRDPRDDGLLRTALRELQEECGIALDPGDVEQVLPHRVARRRAGPFVLVAPYVFHVNEERPAVLDPREAVESRWVPLRLLRDPARHVLRSVPGLPQETLFPAIDLGGVPLWGFTYRLITFWLGLEAGQNREAGFAAARQVLGFVVSRGLEQQGGWSDSAAGKTARIIGAIPAGEVLAHFSRPTNHLPAVNRLEVGPHRIVIAGPEFEEYRIVSS